MAYKPKIGQNYYMINSRFQIKYGPHNGSKKSTERIAAGNAFKTHKKAQKVLDSMKRTSKAVNRSWWELLG